jgi:uncharacterized protein (DUF58 family)
MNAKQHPFGRWWDSARFRSWLNRRVPPQKQITLNLRNIFILPSRQGVYFSLLMLLILVAGINYQNSLAHALAFLLMSLFMVSMLHTYRNLSGLVIVAGKASEVFAGDEVDFTVTLSCAEGRQHEALTVYWPGYLEAHADLVNQSVVALKVRTVAAQRGWFDPGRLTIETGFPLGLFRAWALVDLDSRGLVYPRPLAEETPPILAAADSDDFYLRGEHSDDFAGVRNYAPGDLVRAVSWKASARLGKLMVKEYASGSGSLRWLDWQHYEGVDEEIRLSHLTFWAKEFSEQGESFGIRMPGVEIQPAAGESHRQKVLRSLALFRTDAA